MFEINGVMYTLKFNRRKQDTIERQAQVSLMSEFNKTSGLLPVYLLQIMFAVALVEEADNKPVKGQKAVDIFEEVLEANGYQDVAVAAVTKFQDDMGFMFR